MAMKCPCCETDNLPETANCKKCGRPLNLKAEETALWQIENVNGQIRQMYRGTIERFGAALKIATALTGVTPFLTGLSNAVVVEFHPSSGEWVLMIGGFTIGVSLFIYWPYVEWRQKQKGG